MIEIKPTKEQRQYAVWLTKECKKQFPRDFANDDQAFINKAIGNLGEVVVADYLGIERKQPSQESDGGYDLIIDGHKTDVKTQMGMIKPSEQTYGWNIQASSLKYRSAELILWTHWNRVEDIMTIVGWITKDKIKNVAIHHPKGSINPTTGKEFWCELYEVPTSELKLSGKTV